MEITRDILRLVRDDMNEALAEIGKKHGLLLQCGRGTFTSSAATLKVEMAIASGEGGETVENVKAVADWNALAERYGFDKAWLGKSFTYGAERWTILGLRPTRVKYPVLASNSRGTIKVLPTQALLAAKAMGQFGAVAPKKEFKYEQDGYTVYPARNGVSKTRHGIRVQCRIYRDGQCVALLDDMPERIVAPVEVTGDEAERKLLLQKARAALKAGKFSALGEKKPAESTLFSEYLRAMSMAADQAMEAAQ